jgi:hypothetical protein
LNQLKKVQRGKQQPAAAAATCNARGHLRDGVLVDKYMANALAAGRFVSSRCIRTTARFKCHTPLVAPVAHNRYFCVLADVPDERSAAAGYDEVDVLQDGQEIAFSQYCRDAFTANVARYLVHGQELGDVVARRHESDGGCGKRGGAWRAFDGRSYHVCQEPASVLCLLAALRTILLLAPH